MCMQRSHNVYQCMHELRSVRTFTVVWSPRVDSPGHQRADQHGANRNRRIVEGLICDGVH